MSPEFTTGSQPPRASRREFLREAAGLTFCLTLPGAFGAAVGGCAAEPDSPALTREFNAYVNIAPDGVITIYSPSAEMGQGTLSCLPLIVAEELDADWHLCRVALSPSLGEAYGDPLFLNQIYTVASRSVLIYFDRLRLFGAKARRVLLLNAAEFWNVPFEELRTEPSVVIHDRSGRRLAYGEIASFARIPERPPEVDLAELKDVSDFRLIGKVTERRDLEGKVDGTLQFSIDVHHPGMLHAAVARAPIHGARLGSVEVRDAREMPGVVDIIQRDHQVAVVGRSWFEAQQARARLGITWDRVGAVNGYDSDQGMLANVAAARDLARTGIPWDSAGDLASALHTAVEVFEREYRTDFMYHAGMEPLNAVVWVKDEGASAEVWAGTQAPAWTIDAVARATGVEPQAVTLHRSLMGGAFGRRSVFGMDFVEDAAWISRQLSRPVKVIWSREDDVANGYFRPMTAQRLRAGLGPGGEILGWHHRVACEDPLKHHEPRLFQAWHGIPLIAMHGSEHAAPDGSQLPYAYDLPNRLAEYIEVESGIRVYAMRGVGSLANKFAIESFVDELAMRQGVDPLAFRLKLLHRSDRARAVLNAVAETADWGRRRDGRGLGVSYGHHGESKLACMVEASVDAPSGGVTVHNVWIAADVGIAIQPENVEAQLQGGALFGLSNALMERITIREGLVQQSNFHDYPVLRMNQAPPVHVRLLRNHEPPTGVGETGTVVASAALANAFAAATGRRLNHLPFIPERVKAVLA